MRNEAILVALGGNVPGPVGPPRVTLAAALDLLAAAGARPVRRTRWYLSPPWPDPAVQPWYTNGVALVETDLGPADLLRLLLRTEERLGRVRIGEARWAARPVDLDLLAYGDRVTAPDPSPGGGPALPHPRMHERGFVRVPLAEVAPAGWRHPVLGLGAADLLRALAPAERRRVEPLPEAGG